jgi:hypothetical protein
MESRLSTDAADEKFPFVAFTAPPSGNPDYPGEVCSSHCCRSCHSPLFCLFFSKSMTEKKFVLAVLANL